MSVGTQNTYKFTAVEDSGGGTESPKAPKSYIGVAAEHINHVLCSAATDTQPAKNILDN